MTGNAAGTFRFQKLEIWKKAIEIGHKLLDVADILEKRKLYRFAEQVRGERMRDRIQESGVRSQNEKAASEMLSGLDCMAEGASIRIVGVSLYGCLPKN